MRDIILLVSLVTVSLAKEECGLRGNGLGRKLRSLDQVGKRQSIYGPLGQTAGHGEFPWQVIIKHARFSDSRLQKQRCGGTLIAKNWVLTAAHCFKENYNPSNYFVVVGAWRQYTAELNLSDGTEQGILIAQIIPHTNWKEETYENDIALIKLAKNVDFSSEYIGPACLPNPGDDYRDSKNCWISGWGTWFKPPPAAARPNYLQKLEGNIQSDLSLKATWKQGEILTGMIGFETDFIEHSPWRSGPWISGPCDGDSGGPLVCPSKDPTRQGKYDVVGILSWGPRDCISKPSVSTSVTDFLPWIESNMVEKEEEEVVSEYDDPW